MDNKDKVLECIGKQHGIRLDDMRSTKCLN